MEPLTAAPAVGDAGTQPGRDVATATHRIHWGQWVGRVVVVLVAVGIIKFLVTNPNFDWAVVWAWFRAPSIGKALWTTIWLSAVSMAVGLVFGVLVALARMASNKLVSGLAGIYVWFFRGTPLLVQLIFWFNLAALIPRLRIAIPFGPELASWNTNHVITPVTAAILGLGLNESPIWPRSSVAGCSLSIPVSGRQRRRSA